MKKEILKGALTIEQLEDRFEMTVGALDGCRCVTGDCIDGDGDGSGDGGNTGTGNGGNTGGNTGGGGGGGTGNPNIPDAL